MDVIYAVLKEEIVKKEIYIVWTVNGITRFSDPCIFENVLRAKTDNLAVV